MCLLLHCSNGMESAGHDEPHSPIQPPPVLSNYFTSYGGSWNTGGLLKMVHNGLTAAAMVQLGYVPAKLLVHICVASYWQI